jgi:hypothetical protein
MMENNITLRDLFAIHCPKDWLKRNTPSTVGGMRDELIKRGIIPASRKNGDVMRSYSDSEAEGLHMALRYEYADAMMAARKQIGLPHSHPA